MKANVPQMGELVLLYGLKEDEPRGRAIRGILKKLNLPVKTITPDMLSQTVGWCAELPGFAYREVSAAPGYLQTEEAMVLRGLTGKRLDALLKAMREENLNIALKAVVTAQNMSWELQQLLRELRREREAIRAQMKK